jgi:hypothetical protein
VSKGPARDYTWAPFQKGNTAAVKSGAFSPRKLAQVAEALRPSLAGPVEALPWVEDIDAAEVDDWLVREALWRTLVDELMRRVEEHDGRIFESDRWLLERIGAAQNRAQASRDRLLLNSLYRFRAGRDVAASQVDLARLWADGPTEGASRAQAAILGPEAEG